MEEDKRGVACNTHMREVYIVFLSENLKERGYLEDLDVDGRTILKWI
jgi:hypothetical protein